MKTKFYALLSAAALLIPVAAVILEALPYGAVMRWSPGPNKISYSVHSYFDGLPIGYGNLGPIVTAILTCLIFIAALLTAALHSRTSAVTLTVFSACALFSWIWSPLMFGAESFTPVTVVIGALLFCELAAAAGFLFLLPKQPRAE